MITIPIVNQELVVGGAKAPGLDDRSTARAFALAQNQFLTHDGYHSFHYFIFAGESSGDLHGGPLIQALKGLDSGTRFTGVGGPAMRAQGLTCMLPMEAFQVMGFTDVIAAFPKLWRQFHQVRDAILQTRPDAVILIDYPGFNLRLAKALRKKGFQGKIIQMICPTVWAWGKGRIDQMVSTLDMLLTIYPFEQACFSHTDLPVHYIGHPLVETIANYHYDDTWKDKIGIPSARPIIGIFPGSREGEIIRNLPLQLEAAALLKKAHPEALFALSCIDDKQELHLKEQYKKSPLGFCEDVFFIPRTYTYELMRDCRTAIAKSGTVTLELALHQIPTVVVYQLSTLNRLIAQYVLRLRLPHYCIVNILCNKTVFPEWIAHAPTAENLFHDITSLFLDGEHRSECLKGCLEARQRLSQNGHNTSQLAAQYITTLCVS